MEILDRVMFIGIGLVAGVFLTIGGLAVYLGFLPEMIYDEPMEGDYHEMVSDY